MVIYNVCDTIFDNYCIMISKTCYHFSPDQWNQRNKCQYISPKNDCILYIYVVSFKLYYNLN